MAPKNTPPQNLMPVNRHEMIMKFEKFRERAHIHFEELDEQTNVARQIIITLVNSYEQELVQLKSESEIDKKYVKSLEDFIEKHPDLAVQKPQRDEFVPKPKCQSCGLEKGHKKECPENKVPQ